MTRSLFLSLALVVAACTGPSDGNGMTSPSTDGDDAGTVPQPDLAGAAPDLAPHCTVGQLCDGVCVDVSSNHGNCGAGGSACATDQVCKSGQCVGAPGTAGTPCVTSADCTGGLDCVDKACGSCGGSYPAYCAGFGGSCWTPGVDCSTIVKCSDGTLNGCSNAELTFDCSTKNCVCPTGQSWCYSTCVDEQNDPANCGGCGVACAGGQYCSGGRCVYSCGAGETACTYGCADLQTDTSNCGWCGHTCGVNQYCSSGSCITGSPGCPAGENYCPGYGCTNLQTDWGACGACGNSCDSPPFCTDVGCISCYYACQQGACVQQYCSGP
jgi:hypothetical protein